MSTIGIHIKGIAARLQRVGVLALVLVLGACAADQIVTQAPSTMSRAIPPGHAAVTITRTDDVYAMALKADVDANGTRIASIARGASWSGFVKSGPVELSVSGWSSPGQYTVHFTAEPGRRYAFEITPRNEQFAIGLMGGMVGLAIDAAANSGTSGSFKIAQVPANR